MSQLQTTTSGPHESSPLLAALRWRAWPFVDHRRWSWLVVVGVVVVVGTVGYRGGWLLGLLAAVALGASLWQFFLPVTFEVDSLGLRRGVLGRKRIFPWHAVRSYQPRATGIVLYPHTEPMAIDALRAIFLPYGPDVDETLCVVRQYLGHATELPG